MGYAGAKLLGCQEGGSHQWCWELWSQHGPLEGEGIAILVFTLTVR